MKKIDLQVLVEKIAQPVFVEEIEKAIVGAIRTQRATPMEKPNSGQKQPAPADLASRLVHRSCVTIAVRQTMRANRGHLQGKWPQVGL
jgi:hypothetical protein